MNTLNIVLVEPQIPPNTGNIARTCAVTGASLHLVKPLGFEVSDKHLRRSGLDYWHLLDVYYYENLEDFFSKTEGTYYFLSTKAQQNYCETQYEDHCYLVFGREDAGLPESLLKTEKEHAFRIPMRDETRSLNLSNAVPL